MNHILQIFALYLAQLTFGSAFLLPFYPLRVTGKSFPRFYYGMITLCFIFFLFCLWRLDQISANHFFMFAFCLWIFGSTLTREFSKTQINLYALFGGISLIWNLIYFKKFWLSAASWWTALPMMLAYVSATLFLSLHLMNMIFGHWYLVNRKLPIQHLIKTCFALMLISALRIVVTGFAVYSVYTHQDTSLWTKLTDFMGHGIFFWARILAGLGVPGLVSVLAYQSAKIGANQSATGIMYAGCVFVLMGEFLALYLYRITGYFF